jgi:outer membrane protein assembly factor BamB
MRSAMFATSLTVILVCGLSAAADWPWFQGPNGDGTTPETGLLRSWPTNGPARLWTAEIGPGYGGPSVADGRVYVLDRVGQSGDALRCLDLEDGGELWRYDYDAPGELSHHGSRSTPTVEGDRVYTLGPFGDLHAINVDTHEPVWRRNILKDYDGALPRWGVAQSPVLHGDALVVTPMSATVGVVAMEKATGKEIWRSEPLGNLAYVTPRHATLGGVEQFLVVSATRNPPPAGADGKPQRRPSGGPELLAWLKQVNNRVAGVSAEDGTVLWTYEGWHCMNPIPQPTPIGDDRVFVTGGYGGGSVMLRITASDGAFSVTEAFALPDYGAQVAHPILHGDHLYMLCNGNFGAHGLVCMDLEGNIKWQTDRAPRMDRGLLLLADGLLYSLDGEEGLIRLIRPDPEAYRQVSQTPFPKGDELWGPIVLADGRLLVRGNGALHCLDVRAPGK